MYTLQPLFSRLLVLFIVSTFINSINAQTFNNGHDKRIPFAKQVRIDNVTGNAKYISIKESIEIPLSGSKALLKKYILKNPKDSYHYISTKTDKLGFTHTRYQQMYDGVPIYGAQYIIHSKDGVIKSLNGEYYDVSETIGSPNITKTEAIDKALEAIPAEQYAWEDHQFNNPHQIAAPPIPELTIVPTALDFNNGRFELCYKMDIYSLVPLQRYYVFIDAQTGKLIAKESRICTFEHKGGELTNHSCTKSTHIEKHEHRYAFGRRIHKKILKESNADIDVDGTATTKYSGIQTIQTDQLTPSLFRLHDNTRGDGIRTYDLNQSTNYNLAVDFIDSNNVWNNVNVEKDEVATDAHWAAGKTYDFYDTKLQRNSIDGNGSVIKSYIHYGSNYVNAFWNGSVVTYGDGALSGNFSDPLTSLDICAHEITHGITENEADLIYAYESGALNESFSDIFAVAIEFFAKPNDANYAIGDEVTLNGSGIRNIQHPNLHGDPDTYQGTNWYWGNADNGGVHTNSGVQNHWFYLLAEGGSGTNDIGEAYNFDGIGMEKAYKIAYRSLSVYLSPTSDYDDAVFYAMQSAKDLYGSCSIEEATTAKAWEAVGFNPNFSETIALAVDVEEAYLCEAPAAINFINNSTGIDSVIWDFGDGTINYGEWSPMHTYTDTGTYDVKVIGYGCNESVDSITVENLVNISPNSFFCDSTTMPPYWFTTDTIYGCAGLIFDNGGPNGDYVSYSSGTLVIKPDNAATITLEILEFITQSGSDKLRIYDGESTSAPLLATYSGYLGETVTVNSTSGVLTLTFTSNSSTEYEGFKIFYYTDGTLEPPIASFEIDEYNPPVNAPVIFSNNSNINGKWAWDFGDGTTSVEKHPTHHFLQSGEHIVTLTITGCQGISTHTDTVIVQEMPSCSYYPSSYSITLNSGETSLLPVTFNNNGSGTLYVKGEIEDLENWLQLGNTEHYIAAGDSAKVFIFFNSDGLTSGVYTDSILITQGDTAIAPLYISVEMTVIGEPIMALSSNTIDFGEVFIGYPESTSLSIQNVGSDPLVIDSFYLTQGHFDIHLNQDTILPNQTATFTIVFDTLLVGNYSDELVIINNDTDTTINVQAIAIGIPTINLYPEVLTVELPTNSLDTGYFTLKNQGASTLTYDLKTPFDRNTNVAVYNYDCNQTSVTNISNFIEDANIPFLNVSTFDLPLSTGLYDIDDSLRAYVQAQQIDIIVIPKLNFESSNSSQLYAYLDEFTNDGGVVVLCYTREHFLQNIFGDSTILDGIYSPQSTITIEEETHPFFDNITSPVSASPLAGISTQDTSLQVMAKISDNNATDLTFVGIKDNYYFLGYSFQSTFISNYNNNSKTLLSNVIKEAQRVTAFDWIEFTDTIGSVASNMEKNIPVHFDATDKALGTYSFTLPIESNDPVNPLILGKAEMKVVGNVATSFSFGNTTSCSGVVLFKDETINTPTSWLWNFGDGNISEEQFPIHYYENSGTYTVSLKACNSLGCDSLLLDSVLTIDKTIEFCDTTIVPNSGTTYLAACKGVLVDDGGIDGDYTPSPNSYFIIHPPNAQTITLDFQALQLGYNVELIIYDGGDEDAPQLGTIHDYDDIPEEPITSSGGVMMIRFTKSNSSTAIDSGFVIHYDADVVFAHESDFDIDSLIPQNAEVFFENKSATNLGHIWNFGDGQETFQPNPHHVFETAGNYTINHTIKGCGGEVSTSKDIVVDVVPVNFTYTPDTIEVTLESNDSTTEYINLDVDENGGLLFYDVQEILQDTIVHYSHKTWETTIPQNTNYTTHLFEDIDVDVNGNIHFTIHIQKDDDFDYPTTLVHHYVFVGTGTNSVWIGDIEGYDLLDMNNYLSKDFVIPYNESLLDDGVLKVRVYESSYLQNYNPSEYHKVWLKYKGDYWLGVSADLGQTEETQSVPVSLYSYGLEEGTHYEKVIINTNVASVDTVEVPIILHVSKNPSIETSSTSYDYNVVYLDSTSVWALEIYNAGNDTLTIDSILMNGDNMFLISSVEGIDILPYDTLVAPVSFTPLDTFNYDASIYIYNNDETVIIPITGEGQYPPQIEFIPDTFIVVVSPGELLDSSFAIKNAGMANLTYDIEAEEQVGTLEMLFWGTFTYGIDQFTANNNIDYFEINKTVTTTMDLDSFSQILKGKHVLVIPALSEGVGDSLPKFAALIQEFLSTGGSLITMIEPIEHPLYHLGLIHSNISTSIQFGGDMLVNDVVGLSDDIDDEVSISYGDYAYVVSLTEADSAIQFISQTYGFATKPMFFYKPFGNGHIYHVGTELVNSTLNSYTEYRNFFRNVILHSHKQNARPSWLIMEEDSTTVLMRDSLKHIPITFDASEINENGTYGYNLRVVSNDLDNENSTVHLKMIVSDGDFADFDLVSHYPCHGEVQFENKSASQYNTTWNWDFGDGNTSTKRAPKHTYSSYGSYAVSLIACNVSGCDTVVKENIVVYAPVDDCDSSFMYRIRSGKRILTNCAGEFAYDAYNPPLGEIFYDTIQISPPDASAIRLSFDYFDFSSLDSVYIYNGSTLNETTLMGVYGNNELKEYSFLSDSGTVTIVSMWDHEVYTSFSEFRLVYEAIANMNDVETVVTFTPETPQVLFEVEFVSNVEHANSYFWDFDDGTYVSNMDSVQHQYTSAGVYNVTHEAFTCAGSDKDTLVVNVESTNIEWNPTSISVALYQGEELDTNISLASTEGEAIYYEASIAGVLENTQTITNDFNFGASTYYANFSPIFTHVDTFYLQFTIHGTYANVTQYLEVDIEDVETITMAGGESGANFTDMTYYLKIPKNDISEANLLDGELNITLTNSAQVSQGFGFITIELYQKAYDWLLLQDTMQQSLLSSLSLEATISSVGKDIGVYTDTIQLLVNDTLHSPILVPVTMTVLDSSNFDIQDTVYNYGTVGINSVFQDTIEMIVQGNIDVIVYGITGNNEQLIFTPYTGTITEGNNVQLPFEFIANYYGNITDTIFINTNIGVYSVVISAFVDDANVAFAVTPNLLYLESLALNSTAIDSFFLENTGLDSVEIIDISSSNDSVEVSTYIGWIEGGENVTMYITFFAEEEGLHSSIITVTTNVGVYELSYYAFVEEIVIPSLMVSDTLFDFGNVSLNQVSSDSFMVTNNGNVVVNINALSSSENINVSGETNLIDIGEVKTYSFEFTSLEVGVNTGEIYLNTDAGNITIHVQSYVVPNASISLSDTIINFGLVELNNTDTVTLSINNTGNLPVEILGLESNNDKLIFTPFTGILPPNTSESIFFEFLSNEVGTNESILSLSTNIGNYDITFLSEAEVVSIHTIENVGDALIFPNPTTRKLNVQLTLQEHTYVELIMYNMVGKKVIYKDLSTQVINEQFDMTGLAEGIYWLEIKIADKSYPFKIIKK